MTNANNSRRRAIIIIFFLLLILVALYFFLNKSGERERGGEGVKEEVKSEKEQFEEMKEGLKPVYVFDEDSEKNRQWSEEDFARTASVFAKRFGSYSNQSDFGNITDLETSMSSKMNDWASDHVRNLRNNSTPVDEHYSIITDAFLSAEVKGLTDKATKVEALVRTKRLEKTGSNSRSFEQDILITFVKEGGEWLIDDATWQ